MVHNEEYFILLKSLQLVGSENMIPLFSYRMPLRAAQDKGAMCTQCVLYMTIWLSQLWARQALHLAVAIGGEQSAGGEGACSSVSSDWRGSSGLAQQMIREESQ
jgi:hypothetical protein